MTDTQKLRAEYLNPKILLVDGALDDVSPIKSLLEKCIGVEKRPILIIVHELLGVAFQALVQSRAQNGVPILVCKASQFGDFRKDLMTDVAIATGATILGGTLGVKAVDLTYEMLGECDKVTADRFSTTIVGGKGDKQAIDGRIALLEELIKECRSDYEKEKLQERYAKLTSGVAVIKVGAETEIEQKEKKMRVEDALCATKCALDGGIVPGGGIAYLNASKISEITLASKSDKIAHPLNEDEKIGWKLVMQALMSPIAQIAKNSGISGEEVIARIKIEKSIPNYGYNFLTNEYGDLVKMGVIDPTKVVVNALKNSVSAVGMLLSTEVCIYESEEDVVPPARTPKPREE